MKSSLQRQTKHSVNCLTFDHLNVLYKVSTLTIEVSQVIHLVIQHLGGGIIDYSNNLGTGKFKIQVLLKSQSLSQTFFSQTRDKNEAQKLYELYTILTRSLLNLYSSYLPVAVLLLFDLL